MKRIALLGLLCLRVFGADAHMTAEHIVLAEAAMFGNVQKAISSPMNPEWGEKTKGKTEFIERVMAPRMRKATAPEPIVSRRRPKSLEGVHRGTSLPDIQS